MRASHYLQSDAAALICDNVPLPLCAAAAAAACFLNGHIRAESTSVVLIKVDMVEMASTQKAEPGPNTLLVNGSSAHSVSAGSSLSGCEAS